MGCFADDPAAYFQGQSAAAHHLSLAEQEALQIEAVQQRFATMRDAIPPLTALADAAGVGEITTIDDVAPLLFPHSFYKSFPPHLISERDFAPLTEWLSRLTLLDVSPVKGRSFASIDGWLDALDSETELMMTHSSGTTGGFSLYPRGRLENERQMAHYRMCLPEWTLPPGADPRDIDFAVIWLGYAKGRSAAMRGADFVRNGLAASSDLFFPLLPQDHSADYQLYVADAHEAMRRNVRPPEPSAYVQAKIAEAEAMYAHQDDRMRAMLNLLRGGLSGRKVMLTGGPLMLYQFASAGLAAGMEPGLPPGSLVRSIGGLKGMDAPADLDEVIRRFSGDARQVGGYGMTEVTTAFNSCAVGRFHIPPWVLPLVLDPYSGQPLPRKGSQRGRAAFVDLVTQTYWGGVISADLVEVLCGRCACGRTSPSVGANISRIPAPLGEDMHAIGGHSAEALHAALHALNQGIG